MMVREANRTLARESLAGRDVICESVNDFLARKIRRDLEIPEP